MGENNENIQRLVEDLKRSVNILISAPMIFAPVLIGSIVLGVLESFIFVVADPFGWYWIGDLSWYSTSTIIISFIQVFLSAVIFNLTALATLDIAKRAILGQEFSIQESFQQLTVKIVDYVIISLVCQLMIFSYVLIPVGIAILIVAIVEDTDYLTTIYTSIGYVQENLIDMVLISLGWLTTRFIMVQIPVLFNIQIIPDLIIGTAVLLRYLEK